MPSLPHPVRARPTAPRRPSAGATFVELVVGLAIAALLCGFAVPNYRHWLTGYRLTSHAEHLAGSMNRARSEAVKSGHRVNLCKSRDLRQCADDGPWSQGWIVFVDVNHNGIVDDGEPILRREGPAPEGVSMGANRPVDDYVSYTSIGHARMVNGALQMGTFTLCREGHRAIHVVLANSGRVRIDRTGDRCP